MFRFVGLSLLVLTLFTVPITSLGNYHENYHNSRLSLASSSWPSDHADSSRSKFTIGAGLPMNFNPNDLKVMKQEATPFAQWIYTAGNNSDLLYVMGGNPMEGLYIAKLNSVSLELLEKVVLPPALYIGGLLIHGNGNVYCVHGNRLIVFHKGDLHNSNNITIPYRRLNGHLIQTNGMLVTQDGYLVIKQWSLILEDLQFFLSTKPQLMKLIMSLLLVSTTGVLMCRNKSFNPLPKENMFLNILVAILFGAILTSMGFMLIVFCTFKFILGSFSPYAFVANSLLSRGGGGGELKIIDPLTLTVVAEAMFPERSSFARMSMSALVTPNGEHEDAIVLLGDENLSQFRWRPSEKKLFFLPSYRKKYRTKYDGGTFPGTGPAIYDSTIYFTDNTFPVNLGNPIFTPNMFQLDPDFEKTQFFPRPGDNTFKLFAAPLGNYGILSDPAERIESENYTNAYDTSLHTVDKVNEELESVRLTSSHTPGFFFWSSVINPTERSVIVWDSGNANVQCRFMSNLTLHWQISVNLG